MAIRVTIPSPLQQYTDDQETVDVQGTTVGEALASLADRYAGLRKHLFTECGELRSFVNVYLNDEDIRFLQRGATRLHDEDVLAIVPSIAGGRETSGAFVRSGLRDGGGAKGIARYHAPTPRRQLGDCFSRQLV